jgi:hypothetical protein
MREHTMPRTKSPIKARLDEWNLKSVPFPAVPFVDFFNEDPRRNGTVFAPELRADAIERIRHEILKQGFPGLVKPWSWIWARRNMGGNLGMGKTALLTFITNQVNKDYGQTFFGRAAQWIAVYVPIYPTTRSIDEIAALALASICSEARGISVERLLLGCLRRKVAVVNTANRYPAQLRAASEIRFTQDKWLRDNGVDLDTLASDVEHLLRAEGVRQKVAHAVATGTLRDYLAELNGNPELIPPSRGYQDKAQQILLNDMAHVVRASEIGHVTFFVDNFYLLVRATRPADRPALAQRVRDLVVDGAHVSVRKNLYNWVAVMHTKTAPVFNEAWESCDMHVIAPLSVNAMTSVSLSALPLKYGRAMLEVYLGFQRPARARSQTFPFAPEALDAIVRVASEQGKAAAGMCEPRSLLQAAWEVTSRALLDGAETPIGAAFVEHVLTGAPLPPAVSAADDEAEVTPSERPMTPAIVCTCPCHADEDTPAHDVIALTAGTDEQPQQRITGYRCGLCNMPLVNMPVAVSSR